MGRSKKNRPREQTRQKSFKLGKNGCRVQKVNRLVKIETTTRLGFRRTPPIRPRPPRIVAYWFSISKPIVFEQRRPFVRETMNETERNDGSSHAVNEAVGRRRMVIIIRRWYAER